MMKVSAGFWIIYRRIIRKQESHQKFFPFKKIPDSFTTATASFALLTSLTKSLGSLRDSGKERAAGVRLDSQADPLGRV